MSWSLYGTLDVCQAIFVFILQSQFLFHEALLIKMSSQNHIKSENPWLEHVLDREAFDWMFLHEKFHKGNLANTNVRTVDSGKIDGS